MARTVTYDTLKTAGTNVWVDTATGDVRLETHFSIRDSVTGESKAASKETTHLLAQPFDPAMLPPNPTRRDLVLLLAQGLEADLRAEELG